MEVYNQFPAGFETGFFFWLLCAFAWYVSGRITADQPVVATTATVYALPPAREEEPQDSQLDVEQFLKALHRSLGNTQWSIQSGVASLQQMVATALEETLDIDKLTARQAKALAQQLTHTSAPITGYGSMSLARLRQELNHPDRLNLIKGIDIHSLEKSTPKKQQQRR